MSANLPAYSTPQSYHFDWEGVPIYTLSEQFPHPHQEGISRPPASRRKSVTVVERLSVIELSRDKKGICSCADEHSVDIGLPEPCELTDAIEALCISFNEKTRMLNEVTLDGQEDGEVQELSSRVGDCTTSYTSHGDSLSVSTEPPVGTDLECTSPSNQCRVNSLGSASSSSLTTSLPSTTTVPTELTNLTATSSSTDPFPFLNALTKHSTLRNYSTPSPSQTDADGFLRTFPKRLQSLSPSQLKQSQSNLLSLSLVERTSPITRKMSPLLAIPRCESTTSVCSMCSLDEEGRTTPQTHSPLLTTEVRKDLEISHQQGTPVPDALLPTSGATDRLAAMASPSRFSYLLRLHDFLPKSAIHEATPSILPTLSAVHPSMCRCITSLTLFAILKWQAYIPTGYQVTIIDCRFPFEYQGGHITGAINLCRPDSVLTHLFGPQLDSDHISSGGSDSSSSSSSSSNGDSNWCCSKKNILIFHCEFSKHRAPAMYHFVRKQDRALHAFPHLQYPHMYLLEGGYQAFFRDYTTSDICTPNQYIPMNHPSYHGENVRSRKELHTLWKKFHHKSIL